MAALASEESRSVVPDASYVVIAVIIGGAALLLRFLMGLGPGRESREIWMGGNQRWPLTAVRRFLAAIAIMAAAIAASVTMAQRTARSGPGQPLSRTSAEMRADGPPYPVRLTTASCNELTVALAVYRARYSRYPTALTDSVFLSILRVRPVTHISAPTDGWEHPFRFQASAGGYMLSSPGPDGVEATGDEIVCSAAPSV